MKQYRFDETMESKILTIDVGNIEMKHIMIHTKFYNNETNWIDEVHVGKNFVFFRIGNLNLYLNGTMKHCNIDFMEGDCIVDVRVQNMNGVLVSTINNDDWDKLHE